MKHPCWSRLNEELELWKDHNTPLTLWWRDDDACSDTAALEQLLTLADQYRLPLSLAVIPQRLERSLISCLDSVTGVSCLLHGYDHTSYAAPGERNQELGDHRPIDVVLQSLRRGHQHLQQELPHHYQPVLVPPWNRINQRLLSHLPEIGLSGLSTLGPRIPRPQLSVNNVHLDLIDWKRRCFAGEDSVISQLIEHLKQRRQGQVDSTEATGIMTHHLAHDAASWVFLRQLLEFLSAYEQVVWPDIGPLFPARD
ncbi:polysaccharide deacetylase family protein [Aestuariirhabdus sp. LZHN29]|uniref:polysaccharide deacetylase family protein n=1 Tax=Aestuariirhabdus sp. LZHN29 TaxID=3417462 RepID=UPI003CF7C378